MRLFRSPLIVIGIVLAAIGLLITLLSAMEWRSQLDRDEAIRTGGTAVPGSVVGVIRENRDGTPVSVRVNYEYKGAAKQAEVQLAGYPSPRSLSKGSTLNLLVDANEPSFPRLAESVDGGDAAAWRNGAFAGVVVVIAGSGLFAVPIVRARQLGDAR